MTPNHKFWGAGRVGTTLDLRDCGQNCEVQPLFYAAVSDMAHVRRWRSIASLAHSGAAWRGLGEALADRICTFMLLDYAVERVNPMNWTGQGEHSMQARSGRRNMKQKRNFAEREARTRQSDCHSFGMRRAVVELRECGKRPELVRKDKP